MLERGVERMGDEDLGLKLARTVSLGTGGIFDYGMRSAATLGEAVAFAERSSRLLSDSLHIALEMMESQAVIRFDSEIAWPKAAAGFVMGAWYTLHIADQVPVAANVECWFPHTSPDDLCNYERTFAGAKLKFNTPFYGFAFDGAYELAPGPGSDPALHAMLCARVDVLLGELSRSRMTTLAVRRLVAQEMKREAAVHENALAERVASAMRVSRRTLSRRLEQEGTSFISLADTVRRETALVYVLDGRLALSEVAYLLGFSHVESFHRAFKRWTGSTPIAYRSSSNRRVAPLT
jgi:AraC-like DNA-binding protein